MGVHTVEMQESVAKEWGELKEKYGLSEDLALEDYSLPPSDLGLAHILWRVGKQLVALLEKEYGFGRKEMRDRSPIGHFDPTEPIQGAAVNTGLGNGEAKKNPRTRTITCLGCEGTFEAIDDRTGTVNEIIHCASCAKSLHGVQIK